MQSPELTLCGKDVNLLLGQVDSVDAVDYRSLGPKVFDLLAVRLSVCFSSTVIVHIHCAYTYCTCTMYKHFKCVDAEFRDEHI